MIGGPGPSVASGSLACRVKAHYRLLHSDYSDLDPSHAPRPDALQSLTRSQAAALAAAQRLLIPTGSYQRAINFKLKGQDAYTASVRTIPDVSWYAPRLGQPCFFPCRGPDGGPL
jgi:hypothetical protein